MIDDILALAGALVLLFAIYVLLANLSDRERGRHLKAQDERIRARIRRQEEAERQRLAMLVEWDDGLDVSKLEVRHEPMKGDDL